MRSIWRHGSAFLTGVLAAWGGWRAGFLAWRALVPLDAADRGLAPAIAAWSAVLLGCLAWLALMLLRRRGRRVGVLLPAGLGAAVVLAWAAAGLAGGRWQQRLKDVPYQAHAMPVEAGGYQIEKLPFRFVASFARGSDVYFADGGGAVFKADDADPGPTITKLGQSAVHPRMLFVSTRGTIFLSGSLQPMVASDDGGKTWRKCLDWPFWRMDEDEKTGVLYAGNYSPRNSPPFRAAVFKSADQGRTWREVFGDAGLDHIHTVRFDGDRGRLYIATGDRRGRGQWFSDDGGGSWRKIGSGAKQGNTDVAFSEAWTIWGSDDWLGRIGLSPRSAPDLGRTRLWCNRQQIWFVVARARQAYAGTFAEKAAAGQAVYLLASDDAGWTWRKLMEFKAQRPGPMGLFGESRRLSASGWLYFTTTGGDCWRVRNKALPAPSK